MTICNKKEITIKELSIKYKKSTTYFRAILCRPEFNQFNISSGIAKFIFDNSINFHKMLVFFMEKKYK